MPRLLHLIDTGGVGGAETVLTHLVVGLQAAGWESRVLVPKDAWLFRRLRETSVDTRIVESRGSMNWRLLFSLVREIREFRPDILHAHLLGSGVYATLASTLSGGIPLVCTFHGTPDVDPDDSALPLKARILSRPQNRIVYVSHDLRRHLEPLLGIPHHLGEVIHNGVPFPKEKLRERNSTLAVLDPNVRLIGAVGHIRPAKDYPNLLQAARIVCHVHPEVRFVILGAGEGELFEKLLRLRTELGLENRVHFLGFQSEINSLLASFEIFVSSSETEGLPLATLEAMGMGKPVVLTDCGGVPELVENGRSGMLVPVRSPRALAEGLLRLLEDTVLAKRLAATARTSARMRFSLPSMLDRYGRVYQYLLKRY